MQDKQNFACNLQSNIAVHGLWDINGPPCLENNPPQKEANMKKIRRKEATYVTQMLPQCVIGNLWTFLHSN